MGRQWEAYLHPQGNLRFFEIIAKHWETSDSAKKHEKTTIAPQGFVPEVNASGSSNSCRYAHPTPLTQDLPVG
jgi:hypothetical protein